MLEYTEYISFSSYLADCFQDSKRKNSKFSVRSFAKYLGFRNPSILNDVLRGKRKPTLDMALKLCRKNAYPQHKTDYLIKICEYERANNYAQRDLIMTELRQLVARRTWKVYDLNQYELMTHPHVLIIYSMIAMNDFEPTAAFMKKRVRFKISTSEINSALETLEKLNYIKQEKNGRYTYSHENAVIAAGDATVASELVKRFHLNMLGLIREIFVDINPDDRDVRSTTFSIRSEDFPLLVHEIKEAHQKIMNYAKDKGTDSAYVFSTQLVPSTRPDQ